MKSKKTWVLMMAAAACVGCCAIPFVAVFAGMSIAGLFAWKFNAMALEVLMCFLPLVIGATGYAIYNRRRSTQVCCNHSSPDCEQKFCVTKKEH